MTRHSRNRQLSKLQSDNSDIVAWSMKDNIEYYKEEGVLDPEFEWKRVPMKGNRICNMILCQDSLGMYTVIHVK